MTNPTPPPELVKQWLAEPEYVSGWNGKCMLLSITDHRFNNICAKAAQHGADQELEACCEWLEKNTCDHMAIEFLRAARRPRLSSLKEQALAALATADGVDHPVVCTVITADQHAIIRRALESLPS